MILDFPIISFNLDENFVFFLEATSLEYWKHGLDLCVDLDKM